MSSKMKKIDDKTLRELHKVEIEILDEIVRICEKHKIKYFLIGGTLLGAIRHKGFIPWDDDLDIGMLRKDYDRFLEICTYELNDKYYLDTRKYNKNTYLTFSKVRKNNTTFNEKVSINLDNHKGIFVDVFPYDNIKNPKSKLTRVRNIIIKNAIDALFVKYKLRKIKDCRRPLLCAMYQVLPGSFINQLQEFLMKRDCNKPAKYICEYTGCRNIEREMLPKEFADDLILVTFEGKKYYAFKEYDTYLTKVYGDYMTLPPEEERVNHCPDVIDFKHGKSIKIKDVSKKR